MSMKCAEFFRLRVTIAISGRGFYEWFYLNTDCCCCCCKLGSIISKYNYLYYLLIMFARISSPDSPQRPALLSTYPKTTTRR